MKRSLCPVNGLGAEEVQADAARAVTRKTLQPGATVIQAGEKFDGLYMVRSGFFKSSFFDAGGEMQVTGFHFPGEVFGVDGIDRGYYGDTVTALDTSCLCKIPFSLFTGGAAPARGGAPDARMQALVRLMSGVIANDRDMMFRLGKMDSRRRFASFLQDIAERMQCSGFSRDAFRLCMSRTDIANYLCLAIETVSRLFSQFQALGVIGIDRREVTILDRNKLRALAEDADRECAAWGKAG